MVIDRIDWHADSVEQVELPYENGGTHIGMYLAWMILNGHASEIHQSKHQQAVQQLERRQITGRAFLITVCGEKFRDEDMDEEAQKFTEFYYGENVYFDDYENTLARSVGNLYAVEDTWENYDLIEKKISARYQGWKKSNPM